MQKHRFTLATLGLTSTLLAGSINYAAAADADPAVVVVNGEPITQMVFDAYAKQRQAQVGDINSPQVQQMLVEELIVQELLVQQAKERKLDEDPQVVAQLDMVKRNLLAATAARQLIQGLTPSEEEITQAFEQQAGGGQEYRARHILVESEDQAKELIGQIEGGGDFAELARANSIDTGSGANGGDLDWFTADAMVKPFSDAIVGMEKGQLTAEPVQTRFGWHIIRLDDVREATPTPLEEMRPQLVQQLQSQKFNQMIQGLREEAEVEMK